MAQENLVQEGVDRIGDAVRSIDDEFQRVQKRIRTQRRNIEKQLNEGRRSFEKRTRKQAKRVRAELRKSPYIKRAQRIQKDASRALEDAVERVLGTFQIASKADVDRIDRKLTQLNRKLRELEKARKSNGSVSTHSSASA